MNSGQNLRVLTFVLVSMIFAILKAEGANGASGKTFEKQLSDGTIVRLYKIVIPSAGPDIHGMEPGDRFCFTESAGGKEVVVKNIEARTKIFAEDYEHDRISPTDAILYYGWISVLCTHERDDIEVYSFKEGPNGTQHFTYTFLLNRDVAEDGPVKIAFQVVEGELTVVYSYNEYLSEDNKPKRTYKWDFTVMGENPQWTRVSGFRLAGVLPAYSFLYLSTKYAIPWRLESL